METGRKTIKLNKLEKLIIAGAIAITLALAASAFGADSIQDIEDNISTIDLDQSKDDIRADLDNIIQELEDIKGQDLPIQSSQPSNGLGYRFVPVPIKHPNTPVCTP